MTSKAGGIDAWGCGDVGMWGCGDVGMWGGLRRDGGGGMEGRRRTGANPGNKTSFLRYFGLFFIPAALKTK
ncbi:hypothetical protein ACOALA_18855 [Alicyclobacillus acidoterrestris]|uniref:hypothetical protein n=1 Tax=Alicyclobacillus acidoterrestris TaxID=1450 RepID=UPI003F52DE24